MSWKLLLLVRTFGKPQPYNEAIKEQESLAQHCYMNLWAELFGSNLTWIFSRCLWDVMDDVSAFSASHFCLSGTEMWTDSLSMTSVCRRIIDSSLCHLKRLHRAPFCSYLGSWILDICSRFAIPLRHESLPTFYYEADDGLDKDVFINAYLLGSIVCIEYNTIYVIMYSIILHQCRVRIPKSLVSTMVHRSKQPRLFA